MSGKLVASWILGSVFMLLGVWIVSNLELNLGVSEFSYAVTLILAFILFLLAGFSWISVAVATRQHH
ncbi:MAG: hypothetical protein KKC05_04000 [Nanoarchaeota archaeon]|nr:hypothetical protein [Nanoarchaeota archaeon]